MSGEEMLDRLNGRLEPLRAELLNHPIFEGIDDMERLHKFMQSHIFAVWDFMSLLKALQRRFCNTSIPWLPPTNPQAARLVTEIVLCEECDDDGQGGFASHYDLYYRAMRSCQANTKGIDQFISALHRGSPAHIALDANAPQHVRRFVRETFDIIGSGDVCSVAAAFLLGRDDLLPGLFHQIVEKLNTQTGALNAYQVYLSRRMNLDSNHHGAMAGELLKSLCGESEAKWLSAEQAATRALEARIKLWDGTHRTMQQAALA